ncbi:hypothetical protein COU19_00655 [Candidatus Kaiserbacteria bacterium CG10_big_fil_rev_8_21_14_0_10_56_12]|uniref:Uncharacterized protein n=1 Tax=Candidatus Kaiserbacteria bacterium CG10_big_fil_rev_8_21_14_0_10_56_12 TaxID=1974611 RepID=A0A2H0UAE4_9BACT|nr:MAG: hypothetical protein COU19_00655 [Candidatus Kaiserbacteria bacterium CG10_big_fil_rev_8_21_14_0_10_56_12]
MTQERPKKPIDTPIQDEMHRLEEAGAFKRPERINKPIPTPIQDEMHRLKESGAFERPLPRVSGASLRTEASADPEALFPEQTEAVSITDEGEVTVPDRAEEPYYIDPADGEIHQKQPGSKRPPHSRSA